MRERLRTPITFFFVNPLFVGREHYTAEALAPCHSSEPRLDFNAYGSRRQLALSALLRMNLTRF